MVLMSWAWLRDVRKSMQGTIDDMLASDNAAGHRNPPIDISVSNTSILDLEDLRYHVAARRCNGLQWAALLHQEYDIHRQVVSTLDARPAYGSIGEEHPVTDVRLIVSEV